MVSKLNMQITVPSRWVTSTGGCWGRDRFGGVQALEKCPSLCAPGILSLRKKPEQLEGEKVPDGSPVRV